MVATKGKKPGIENAAKGRGPAEAFGSVDVSLKVATAKAARTYPLPSRMASLATT